MLIPPRSVLSLLYLVGTLVLGMGAVDSACAAEGEAPPTPVSLPDDPANSPSGDRSPISGTPRWLPEGAKPEKWDWVLLNTGEWLKGTIEGIRNDRMDFDSDKFDDVQLKMEDVVRTYSVMVNTFVLTEQRVVVGVGEFFPDSVEIKTKSGKYSYPREELLSLVMGDRNERKLWSGKANVGISSSSGNTNQMTANIQASIRRRGAFLRLDSSYYGNFGQARGVTNVRNQQLSLQADLFIRDRFFLIPVVFEYYTDEFSNIDFRIRPGSGMGYQIAQSSDLEWDITALAQYQRLDFVSVLPGQNSNSESFAVSVANHTSWDITDDLSLDTDYTLTLPTTSLSNPDQQAIITLAVDITKYLSLTSTLNWTRVGNPQEQADGTVPEQDDISISFGFGFTF